MNIQETLMDQLIQNEVNRIRGRADSDYIRLTLNEAAVILAEYKMWESGDSYLMSEFLTEAKERANELVERSNREYAENKGAGS